MKSLVIKDLHVEIEGKKILNGINLELDLGKINALMGPNGSGKSTLVNTLMGHPKYIITQGEILFNGEKINEMPVNERAKKGMFLSFQYPREIEGVKIKNFLRQTLNSLNEKNLTIFEFKDLLNEKMKLLGVSEEMINRYLNQGFSGGEKKKMEILQMLLFNPKLILLDETDSGLDIDSLRTISKGVNAVMNENKTTLIITHYKRILEYIKPDKIFIMINGKIALSGNGDLVNKLEEKGYGWIDED